jgi:glycogen operon protein
MNWDVTEEQQSLMEFVSRLVHLRRAQPVLRRRRYFKGEAIGSGGAKDVAWLAPDGGEMTGEAWGAAEAGCLGMQLSGAAIEELDERGEQITGDTLLLLLNGSEKGVPFILPALAEPRKNKWLRMFDTADTAKRERAFAGGTVYPLDGESLALFKITPPLRERRLTGLERGADRAEPTQAVDMPAGPGDGEPVEPVPVGSEG